MSNNGKRYRGVSSSIAIRQWLNPIGLALLAIILVSASSIRRDKNAFLSDGTQCTANIDASIAGKGVRIAALIQICILSTLYFRVSFHADVTGGKAVGGGLVLTTLSLAIALIVRSANKDLTPVDAILSAMILDGEGMALFMQPTSKETPVATRQIGVVGATQLFALSTTIAMSRY